jgi:TolA-binding protein
MRRFLVSAMILASLATPSLAQRRETPEQRIDRIEKELHAVQRKVFPGGAGAIVEPEILPQPAGTSLPGVPATNAVADLNARVDALEGQLRNLTNQAEENGHRLRQLEAAFAQSRSEADARVAAATAAPPAAAEAGADEAAPVDAAPSTGDPGEDAYLVGFRAWDAKRYGEAEKVLEGMIKRYPKHARASFARNLLGRAYLDEGKPATAAKAFLANYQTDPKGERAQDSLYFLGQSLVALEKPTEACKVYDELQDVYGSTMRDWVKQRLPKARQQAKCG